jgi:RsiW-degrading membrane proteinase PrsW (M82 family)
MYLLALALAPVVFLMTYLYVKDEYDREPLLHLFIAFGLGILCSIPVIYVGGALRTLLGVNSDSDPFALITYAFVVVALTEEGMKYLVLRWHAYRLDDFDEPYDGIMYGATVSLGFAAIENVLYVFQLGESVAFQRMFTAVPAHAVFGILMGYYFGRARFIAKGSAQVERLKGLGLAVLFHGLYDYFLFLNWGYLVLLAFVVLFIGLKLSRRAIRQHKELSPHKPVELHDPDEEPPPAG